MDHPQLQPCLPIRRSNAKLNRATGVVCKATLKRFELDMSLLGGGLGGGGDGGGAGGGAGGKNGGTASDVGRSGRRQYSKSKRTMLVARKQRVSVCTGVG